MTNIFDAVDTVVSNLDPNDTAPQKKRSKSRNLEALTSTQLRQGRMKLADMIDLAFRTLEEAMDNADYNTATRAAVALLDRTGFGPKSTVDVNTTHVNLSEMTNEELAERALRLHTKLAAKKIGAGNPPIIDVTPKAEAVH